MRRMYKESYNASELTSCVDENRGSQCWALDANCLDTT
jgi:hypothetical protein